MVDGGTRRGSAGFSFIVMIEIVNYSRVLGMHFLQLHHIIQKVHGASPPESIFSPIFSSLSKPVLIKMFSNKLSSSPRLSCMLESTCLYICFTTTWGLIVRCAENCFKSYIKLYRIPKNTFVQPYRHSYALLWFLIYKLKL